MFVLEVIYAVSIFFSNPINLFPIYESVYKIRKIDKLLQSTSPSKVYFIKFIIKVVIVVLCFIVCLFVPNFIDFISFVGSFLFSIIGIYIPVSLADLAQLFLL